ncbi:bile acid:sodium symporter family protein [Bosea sp. NBC_00550]|uniref:bile acid:sodium symporter family protein n=1 Tax=Bosea sp. NBC_00550 TaxID=2969621 RepID=UPI00223129DB|nr:bile acid:sodium symporter family protein [Bosea sp. NBC_00550]UZF90384.1 bile acid:sodium symporter [Bosea sp. NBC_00550]
MIRRTLARFGIDPYLIALMATVAVAAILPARGIGAEISNDAVTVAVALLFFLYGARLSPLAVWEGLLHWRLQSLVFASTYVLFPLLGLLLTRLFGGWLPSELVAGLIFVCILPSTVQSSIAFTSIARGNVAAALCSASVSNLFGIVLTPLLVVALLDSHGSGFSTKAVESIALQILLPFVAGQLLRRWVGPFLQRHKAPISIVDRGSILLVVYAAFSEGMVAGIWSRVTLGDLGLILLLDMVLLAVVLAITTIVSRRLGFSKEDEIAIVFCGSKKSMASGIPMANILFPGQALGLIVLPLMLFHQAQLFACAVLAQRYARRPAQPKAEPSADAALTPAKA